MLSKNFLYNLCHGSTTHYGTLIGFLLIVLLNTVGCNKSGFKPLDSISEGAQYDPTPIPTEFDRDDKIDSQCMISNQYDACIFLKSPQSQTRKSYTAGVDMGMNLSGDQVFGVKLRNLINPSRLESKSFKIKTTSGKAAGPDNEFWKFNYKDDTSKSYVAQLMAYYWLDRFEMTMISRTGKFFMSGKSFSVDAFDSSLKNNAYFDGTQIKMGITMMGGNNSEVALGADVYIHEAAHGNLYFASPSTLQEPDPLLQTDDSCTSRIGCIGAIHEGQADFHVALIFPDRPQVGEHFTNSLNGFTDRNVLLNRNLTATEGFTKSGGEIHGQAAVYSSLMWELRGHPKMKIADFEKMFTLQLPRLTNNSTFITVKNIFLSLDNSNFNGQYKNIITEVFAAKGL